MTAGAGRRARLAAAMSVAAALAAPSPSSAEAAPSACRAPSLAVRAPVDGRDDAALASCQIVPETWAAPACGGGGAGIASLDRLDEAVLSLDPMTARAVREISARGRALGRRPGVFGLVGDSMTETHWFMTPFSSPARVHLPDDVRARLLLADGRDVVAYHRGVPATLGLDPFVAPRAARSGARSTFALPEGAGPSAPLLAMVERLSPEIAIVLFGSNDATVRFSDVATLRRGFRARMERIVDALIERGVIPVLSTVPRRGRERDRPACDRSPADLSTWRISVQVSALSAEVADLACARGLPLVDLRHALDALPHAGLGPDGVHPIGAPTGAGDLRPPALTCGMNARNYVTLRMLRELRAVIDR